MKVESTFIVNFALVSFMLRRPFRAVSKHA